MALLHTFKTHRLIAGAGTDIVAVILHAVKKIAVRVRAGKYPLSLHIIYRFLLIWNYYTTIVFI